MTTKKINRQTAKKNGTAATRPAIGAMGTPAFIFDPKQVQIFGMFRATQETMAEYYGVSIDTIRRRMNDPEGDFCKAYKKGNGMLRMKLMEAQVNAALAGNTSMLIWLGKNILDQKDNVKNEVDITQPISVIVDEDDLDA